MGKGPVIQKPLSSARETPLQVLPTSVMEASPSASLLVVCTLCSGESSFFLPRNPTICALVWVVRRLGSFGMPGSVSEMPFKFAKRAMVEELSVDNGARAN